MIELGRVGIWTRQLDAQSGASAQAAVAELEGLGYPALWIPEAIEREVISHATLLLAGSSRLRIVTGIANVHVRVARAAGLAQLLLAERFPDRFLLGLGVSHPFTVERVIGKDYGSPLRVIREYLDALDATLGAPHEAPAPLHPTERVIAALGPKMLDLAARRSRGAHTYLAPVEHTAWARGVLGEVPLLAPAVKVVLEQDPDRARSIGRWAIAPVNRLPAYRDNLLRLGYGEDDLGAEPSDRIVDALVAWGDIDAIVRRVTEHIDAGADHVCVEVLTGDDITLPWREWRELAPALVALK